MNIFTIIFTQPILNLLVWLHNLIPGNDLGWSIIALTIIIKILLLPLSGKSIKSQKALQDIQPKMDALKNKYKDQKEVLAKEMMQLYKDEKVSPFSSCLPLLVQFPFLIAIFEVLRHGLESENLNKLYSFIPAPESVSTVFLGVFDLAGASIALAVIAGLLQFVQTRMLTHTKQPTVPGSKDENMMSMMNKQIMYVMPIVTIFIGFSLPGGVVLYWAVTTLVTVIQQYVVFARQTKNTGIVDVS